MGATSEITSHTRNEHIAYYDVSETRVKETNQNMHTVRSNSCSRELDRRLSHLPADVGHCRTCVESKIPEDEIRLLTQKSFDIQLFGSQI